MCKRLCAHRCASRSTFATIWPAASGRDPSRSQPVNCRRLRSRTRRRNCSPQAALSSLFATGFDGTCGILTKAPRVDVREAGIVCTGGWPRQARAGGGCGGGDALPRCSGLRAQLRRSPAACRPRRAPGSPRACQHCLTASTAALNNTQQSTEGTLSSRVQCGGFSLCDVHTSCWWGAYRTAAS